MSLLSVTVILFLIIDPVGNVYALLRMLRSVPSNRHTWIVVREMLIALATMVIFYFIGDFLLEKLEISKIAVQLTAGIVLFIAAIKILFPNMGSVREVMKSNGEPFIVPLAIPLVAGPSLLATIMLFSQLDSLNTIIFPAIIISWLCATAILLVSRHLHRFMGKNGLVACEKVMGMILVLLAIQRFLEGIRLFVDSF